MTTFATESTTPTVPLATEYIEADVLVVGAGLSGLTAALDLEAQGLTVAVLEARNRVGGRLHGHHLGDGQAVDLGGEYFGDKSTMIQEIAASVGVESFDSNDKGKRIAILNKGRADYAGLFPRSTGVAGGVDLVLAILRLENLAKTVPPENPWLAERADEFDSQTFSSWMRRNVRTAAAREFLTVAIECVFCTPPTDMSLLHVLNYANASGGLRYLMEVRGGIQKSRFVGGAFQIPQKMAAKLQRPVRLESPVRTLHQSPGRVTANGPGFELKAKWAIVAIPPTLAGRIAYDPPAPGIRDQLTQRLPAGSAIKTIVVYDEPFWRKAGYSGQVIDSTGPFRVVFDTSPGTGTPGVMSAFSTGSAARTLTRKSPSQRRQLIIDGLVDAFGQRARHPIDYVEQNWMDEQYTRGCYHGYAPPGVYTSFGPELRKPFRRIHWAGTETGVHQMGSMGGAVDAGRRAAQEVLIEAAMEQPIVGAGV